MIMEQQLDHILSHFEILRSFNISKKVSSEEIEKIKRMIDKACDTDEKKQELFKKEVLKNTNVYLKTHNIPGVISKNDDNTFSWVINKSKTEETEESDTAAMDVELKTDKYKYIKNSSIKLADYINNTEKLTKKQIVFFIVTLIGNFNLTEKDFDDLYNQIQNGTLESDAETDSDDEKND